MPEESQSFGVQTNFSSGSGDNVVIERYYETMRGLPDRVLKLEECTKALTDVPEKLRDLFWIKTIGAFCIAGALTCAGYLWNEIQAMKETIRTRECVYEKTENAMSIGETCDTRKTSIETPIAEMQREAGQESTVTADK